ncbi:MAG TPA: WhiB family transcriptional regulator [Euzebya sp.]|nr:WhiB family transcriptional regulator [Euzebya sp.]
MTATQDLRPNPRWRADAACAGTDPDMWVHDTELANPVPAVCGVCPVRAACHADALVDIIEGQVGADVIIRGGRLPVDLVRDARRWRPAAAVLLVDAGTHPTSAAAQLGVTVRSVQRWVAAA